ncbi:MAG: SulP family inorganic anion transporter [Planctomycetales bacterium]
MDTGSSPPKSLSTLEALKNDFLPSVVVFLVALPLCLGIAIASGAPPISGLITGIVGGLVVGWISGSPLQVSGPAAGLTVILVGLFQRYEIQFVMLAITLAGLMQITMGWFQLGQWFRAVSPAVVKGMLAGIGVLIFGSQFHIMADDAPRQGMELFGVHLHAGLANLLTIPATIEKVFTPWQSDIPHHWAAGLGLLTIAVVVGWKYVAPKKLELIPGPLLGVALATVILAFAPWIESSWHGDAAAGTLSQVKTLNLGFEDSFLGGLTLPDFAVWASAPWQEILLSALALALIASAETLLCATAVDQMHQGQRTRYDQELMAQGVGNTACGLLGGLPMTGVIVRSSANVEAGGKSRLSTIMHGLWLLLFVACLPFVLRQIPVSSLAAVLVYIGYKLVNPQSVKDLWKYGKSEVAIYFATMITIVCTDLLMGVATGIVLSACKLLYMFSHLEIRSEENLSEKQTTLHLNGTATFIRLPKLAAALERVPSDNELHVNLEHLDYIDHACLDLLMAWEKQTKAKSGSLVIDWESLTAKFRKDNGQGPTIKNNHKDSRRRQHAVSPSADQKS